MIVDTPNTPHLNKNFIDEDRLIEILLKKNSLLNNTIYAEYENKDHFHEIEILSLLKKDNKIGFSILTNLKEITKFKNVTLENLPETLINCFKDNDMDAMSFIYHGMGLNHLQNGNLDKALLFFRASLYASMHDSDTFFYLAQNNLTEIFKLLQKKVSELPQSVKKLQKIFSEDTYLETENEVTNTVFIKAIDDVSKNNSNELLDIFCLAITHLKMTEGDEEANRSGLIAKLNEIIDYDYLPKNLVAALSPESLQEEKEEKFDVKNKENELTEEFLNQVQLANAQPTKISQENLEEAYAETSKAKSSISIQSGKIPESVTRRIATLHGHFQPKQVPQTEPPQLISKKDVG